MKARYWGKEKGHYISRTMVIVMEFMVMRVVMLMYDGDSMEVMVKT